MAPADADIAIGGRGPRAKLNQPAGTGVGDASTAPGEALEASAIRLEAGHPGLAGALRALVDALSKAGI